MLRKFRLKAQATRLVLVKVYVMAVTISARDASGESWIFRR